MMACYGSLCRADEHLRSFGDLNEDFSLLRDYLVSVLGDNVDVPLFLDSMARNGGLFRKRVADFRRRWADIQSVNLSGLSREDAADCWCDALKCIRFVIFVDCFCIFVVLMDDSYMTTTMI
jgi:hypothetical protein